MKLKTRGILTIAVIILMIIIITVTSYIIGSPAVDLYNGRETARFIHKEINEMHISAITYFTDSNNTKVDLDTLKAHDDKISSLLETFKKYKPDSKIHELYDNFRNNLFLNINDIDLECTHKLIYNISVMNTALINHMEYYSDELRKIGNKGRTVTYTLMFCLIAVVITTICLFVNISLRTIKRFTKAIREVKSGKLDYKINYNSPNEYGETAKEFNDMVEYLNASMKRVSKIMEIAPVGIITVSMEGKIMEVNETLLKLGKYKDKSEVIGKNAEDIYANPEDRKVFFDLLKLGDIKSFVAQFKKADGTAGWGSLTSTIVEDENGAYIVSAIQDISVRKQMEEDLRNSEATYRTFFEQNKAIQLVINPENGSIVTANPSASLFYGYKINELKQMNIFDFNISKKDDIKCLMEKVVKDTQIYFRGQHRTKSNGIRDVEVYSACVEIKGKKLLHSIIHDITASVRAEKKLMDSEARFRNIFNNSPAGIIIFDRYGMIKDINHSALTILGIDSNDDNRIIRESMGKYNMFDPIIMPKEIRRKLLKNGNVSYINKIDWKLLSQKYDIQELKKLKDIYLNIMITPVNKEGETDGYIVQYVDLTDQMESQEVLNKALIKLKRSNEDLEQFASVVSHDLKNPLIAIISFINVLRKDYLNEENKDITSLTDKIQSKARRMAEMIDNLLYYSRIDTQSRDDFRCCNAEILIHYALDNLEIEINKSNAEITYDSMPTIECDKIQMISVFQNLIANAIKYCKSTPKIHISAKREYGNHEKNHYEWLFSVKDNGIGISTENRTKIFDIYNRLHKNENEFKGSGIGLAFCKKIIQRHGGEIWVESKIERGSTFFFTINHNKPCDNDSKTDKGINPINNEKQYY